MLALCASVVLHDDRSIMDSELAARHELLTAASTTARFGHHLDLEKYALTAEWLAFPGGLCDEGGRRSQRAGKKVVSQRWTVLSRAFVAVLGAVYEDSGRDASPAVALYRSVYDELGVRQWDVGEKKNKTPCWCLWLRLCCGSGGQAYAGLA